MAHSQPSESLAVSPQTDVDGLMLFQLLIGWISLNRILCEAFQRQNSRSCYDYFLCGDRLSPGSVLCPPQSSVHCCIPGARFGNSSINVLFQFLEKKQNKKTQEIIINKYSKPCRIISNGKTMLREEINFIISARSEIRVRTYYLIS